MKTTRIYLARHGQVVDHHEYRYNGHNDVDITDVGLEQMERLSEFLSREPITAVYSSDLKRAARGAAMIGEALGIRPVKVAALRELHLGRWEGLTREEASALYPEEAHFSFKDLTKDKLKGGESLTELSRRVLPAVDDIVASHPGSSVLIVAHGGVNRVILADVMKMPRENFFHIEQDYGCLNVIDYFADGFKVVKLLNGGPNQELKETKVY